MAHQMYADNINGVGGRRLLIASNAQTPARRSNIGSGSSDYAPAMRAPSTPGVPALAMSHHQQMQPQHQQQQAFAPYQYMANNQQLSANFQNHHLQNNGQGFHHQEQPTSAYLASTEASNSNGATFNFHQGLQTPIADLQEQIYLHNLALTQGIISGDSWHTVHPGPQTHISSPASPFPQMDSFPSSTAHHHGHHPQTMSYSQMRTPSYAGMASSGINMPASAFAPPAPQMLQQPMQSLHRQQSQGYDDQYQKTLAEACRAGELRRRRAEQAARRGPLPTGLRTSQSPLQHQRLPSSQGQLPTQRTSSRAGFGNGGNAHSAAYVNPQDIMTPTPRVMRIDSGYLSGEAPQPSPSSQSSMSYSTSAATPSPLMQAPMRASTPATPGPKMPTKRTIENIQSQLDLYKEASPKKLLKTTAGPTSAPGTPSRDEIQAAYAPTQSQLAAPFVLQPNGQSERRTKHIGCSRPTGGYAPRRVPEHVPTSVAATAGGRIPECDNIQNKSTAGTQGSPIRVPAVATPPNQSSAVKPLPTVEKMSGEQFSQILTAQTKSTAQTTTTPKPSVGPIRLIEGPVTAHENDKAILQGVLDKMKRFGASHGSNPQYGVPAENVQLLKIRKAWTRAFVKKIEMQIPSRMVPAVHVMASAVDGAVEAA
ncbi:hypothetical protein LTR37_018060 [Vermiconidia calcicola]|uniref:Uncharacterized protein n=1 Tax=Vermiconidia calcicola TaxID=1690605 RepID=A0ACC3MIB7_9PEZI|nr:hypothetical protein LTR37_018060 [Vermiconidia calcicola]